MLVCACVYECGGCGWWTGIWVVLRMIVFLEDGLMGVEVLGERCVLLGREREGSLV